MHPSHRRLALLLAAIVATVWTLALVAMVEHFELISKRAPTPASGTALVASPDACDRAAARTSWPVWKLRTSETRPPVRAAAVPTRGGTVGLLLCDVRVGDPLHEIGLRDHDVLRGVDGRRSVSPQAALRIYSRIVAGDARSIDVEREGVVERIGGRINRR